MNTILLLMLSVVIAILTIVIVGVCYYYTMLVRKLSKAQKENVYLRFHLQEKSLNKINEARDRAMQIIADATSQAEEILKKSEVTADGTKEALQGVLKEVSDKQHQALTNAAAELESSVTDTIKQLQEEDINVLKKASKDIEAATMQEVEAFKKELTDKTVGTQKEVDAKVQEALTAALTEVKAYKAERIEKIDEQIFVLLSEITKEIVGKRLTYDDQKDLLKHSLEKVKKEIDALG